MNELANFQKDAQKFKLNLKKELNLKVDEQFKEYFKNDLIDKTYYSSKDYQIKGIDLNYFISSDFEICITIKDIYIRLNSSDNFDITLNFINQLIDKILESNNILDGNNDDSI